MIADISASDTRLILAAAIVIGAVIVASAISSMVAAVKVELRQLGGAVETAILKSASDTRRAIKRLSIPHCHQCHLAAKEDAEQRARRERARAIRRGDIVVVSVTCPICQAPWEFTTDAQGQVSASSTAEDPLCLWDLDHNKALMEAFGRARTAAGKNSPA